MKHDDFSMARRNWLRSVARFVALGGIALITTILVSRSNGSCLRLTLPCQECELLSRCRLPRAQHTRDIRENTAKP